MTAINSNRAIRGPVTAVPVVAGKGVRLVADTENNRIVAEADETVLYENASGGIGLSLSESPMNFEKIKIYYGTPRNGTAGRNIGMAFTEVPTSLLIGGRQGDPSAGYLVLKGVFYGNNTNQSNPYISIGEWAGCNTTSWTRQTNGSIYDVSTGTHTASSEWIVIYQIVGVHRIASN